MYIYIYTMLSVKNTSIVTNTDLISSRLKNKPIKKVGILYFFL